MLDTGYFRYGGNCFFYLLLKEEHDYEEDYYFNTSGFD